MGGIDEVVSSVEAVSTGSLPSILLLELEGFLKGEWLKFAGQNPQENHSHLACCGRI